VGVIDTKELEGPSWWVPLDAVTAENIRGVGSEL